MINPLATLPRAYVLGAAFVLGVGAVTWHTVHEQAATARAIEAAKHFVRDSMTTSAATLAPAQVETLTITRRRTDTVFATTARHAQTVTELASRVADTVRVAFPVVDTLVVESKVLATLVPVLRDSVASERRAADTVRATLSMVATGARDSLHVELKRPKRTFRSSAMFTGTGAILGAVAVHFLHRK